MTNYQYPDTDDRLTLRFLETLERNSPYWAQSEEAIIEYILDFYHDHNPATNGRFLDAGCGKGRLIHVFAPYFQHVSAFEPDEERYRHSLELLKKNGLEAKSEVFHADENSFEPDHLYDLILSSHVIQHIEYQQVITHIKRLSEFCSANGLIAINTCHSTSGREYFCLNYLQNGLPVREEVNREVFNRAVNGKNKLPVHFFETKNFQDELFAQGLETLDYRVFHVSAEDRALLGLSDETVDVFVNSNPEHAANYGVDMCLILRKRQS